MTRKEADQYGPGNPPKPEEHTTLVIVPGYYYVGIWSFPLPKELSKFDKGGDVMAFLFRKETEPEKWHMRHRFRHFKVGRKHDPWAGGSQADEKHWYGGTVVGTEEYVVGGCIAWLNKCAQLAGSKVEFLEVRGNDEAFHAALEREQPHWLHLQRQHTE